jgi:hypothetical protein
VHQAFARGNGDGKIRSLNLSPFVAAQNRA